MSARKAMTPAEQDDLLRRVSGELLASAPADWVKLRLVYTGLVDFATVRLEAMFSDGRVEHWLPPATAPGLMAELRSGMYVETKGTWYTAHLEVDRPGRYTVRYDHDEEPHFGEARPDRSFALDHVCFPRGVDHRPDWLQLKLMGAAEESTEPLPEHVEDLPLEWATHTDAALLRETGVSPGGLTPEVMMDVVQEIVDRTFDALRPKGEWTGILIDHKEIAGVTDTRVSVDWVGSGTELEWLPAEADRLLYTLRTGMYQQGKGTWFRARFRIGESGEIALEFDQKNPPEFDPAPDPRCYLWDVQRFPRSSDHIPDWLLDRLSEAQRIAKAQA